MTFFCFGLQLHSLKYRYIIKDHPTRERIGSGMYTLHNTELKERENLRIGWNEINEYATMIGDHFRSPYLPEYHCLVNSNDHSLRIGDSQVRAELLLSKK